MWAECNGVKMWVPVCEYTFNAPGFYHCYVPDCETCVLTGTGCGLEGCFLPGTLINTKDGLKPIEKLKVDDEVLSKDLKPVVVKSIVRVDKPVTVYNFEVASAHNFFVQGVLVHNRKDD